MSNFMDEMEKGLTQAGHEMEASRCLVGGKPVVCRHCGGGIFETAFSLTNDSTPASFTVGWMNRKVTTLMCVTCGCIERFGREVERV